MVGAGMLALPMVSASAGFVWGASLMVLLWLVSTVTGLLVLEVNLALPSQNSTFSSMAEKTIGTSGKVFTWIVTLFFMYTMIVAYIIGEADILANYLSSTFNYKVPNAVLSTLFTAILGIAVFWSTAAADYVNRGLMTAKGILVVIALLALIPYANVGNLFNQVGIAQTNYLWIAVPAFLCAYSFQFIVPSLRMYLGDDPKQLRSVIVIATTISMLIYLWWLASILGVVPLEGANNSITSLSEVEGASVGMFIQLIITIAGNKWVSWAINGFTIIAMTTAFIGVSLALFDFLTDGLKLKGSRSDRLQIALMTFIPPLVFAVMYPDGFVKAISYIAVPVSILALVLPTMMALKLRSNTELKSPYRSNCGNMVLWAIMLMGIVACVLSVMCIFNLLPGIKVG